MPDCTQCSKPLADDAAFCSACVRRRPAHRRQPGANIVMITALAVIAIVAVIGIVFVATRDSGSRSRTIDPFQLQQISSEDSAVKEGIHSIQIGIQSWAVDNGDVFPPDAEVRPDGGVGTEVDNWPTNPFTGQPTTSGSVPGDFTVP